MLELLLCSMLTIVPDYLFRRYAQGKRFGKEITLYSVWFELRYGISACLILTISLITTIFYFHPSTTNAISLFRALPVLPEGNGRVEEVYVGLREKVKAGQPLFKLDTSQEEAAAETARRRIAETDAELALAKTQLAGADAQVAGSTERLPAGRGRACDQERIAARQRVHGLGARSPEVADARRRQGGGRRRRTCKQAIDRGADFCGSARAESQRRSLVD